ncbi:MAG: DUF4268 domain-containing protein, partial [Patescibacteria group bacterium]|nr:DUF4268 domain-containing protein [Patescibacteria group bacterium]
ANNPECLGEELLIIQKEFDGFNDTNDRLDLLALDKQGNLVVIENKLDDSGKDVTWQVLRYASYCSTLNKEQILLIYQQYLSKHQHELRAEQNILDFFNKSDLSEISLNTGQGQRIIMISGNFRKEVTSTVLWLLSYKLRIQCFKAELFKSENELYINFQQIIPTKEAEQYIISMANKTQENISEQEATKNRHLVRIEFWKELLKNLDKKSTSFTSLNPTKETSLGMSIEGVSFYFVISSYYARVEVYISKNKKELNKYIFDELFKQKSEIEKTFGSALVWERLDKKNACRIKHELQDVNYFNRADWPKMIEFMIDGMSRLEKSFKEPLAKIRLMLRKKSKADFKDEQNAF